MEEESRIVQAAAGGPVTNMMRLLRLRASNPPQGSQHLEEALAGGGSWLTLEQVQHQQHGETLQPGGGQAGLSWTRRRRRVWKKGHLQQSSDNKGEETGRRGLQIKDVWQQCTQCTR